MKRLTFLFAVFFALSLTAQETTFNTFYKNHSEKSTFSMNIDASFAGSFMNDEDTKDLKKLLQKSGDFKIMVFKNDDPSLVKDFKKYVRKNRLKTMARMKSDGSKAEFYILEENDIVKEIVLRANSKGDNLVLLGLKTNFTTDELVEMMNNSNINITTD